MRTTAASTHRQLVGREQELQELDRLLRTERVVTLTGIGGCGKTRLALEVAARQARRGRWVEIVDLSAANDRSVATALVARALNVVEAADRDVAGGIRTALASLAEPLLVLDNMEQLKAPGELISLLLDTNPTARILATSRAPLLAPRERIFAMAALSLPAGDSRDAVETSASGALFLARALEFGQLQEPTDADAHQVAELCRRLDGLPLALELAAMRLRVLSLAEINRLLASDEIVLSNRRPGARQSVEEVLSWTIAELRPEEQEFLISVGECPGTFDLAMARAIAPMVDALNSIEALSSFGLLVIDRDARLESQFRLLDAVRSFARRMPSEARADIRTRHAVYVAGRFRKAGELVDVGSVPAARDVVGGLEVDYRMALATLREQDPSAALDLAADAARYWRHRGVLREPVADLRSLLKLAPVDAPGHTRAQVALGEIVRFVEGLQAAISLYQDALTEARRQHDVEAEAIALYQLGFAAANANEPDLARRSASELLSVAEASGAPRLLARGHSLLGAVTGMVGDREGALGHFQQAGRLAHEAGDAYGEGVSLMNATSFLLELGRAPESVKASERFVELLDPLDAGIARTWANFVHALALSEVGNAQEATDAYRRGATRARELGSPELVRWALEAAVPILIANGEFRLAGEAFAAAEPDPVGAPSTNPVPSALVRTRFEEARRRRDGVALELVFRRGTGRPAMTILDDVLHAFGDAAVPKPPAKRLRHGNLTVREVEVLGLLAEGRSDGEIAEALGISRKTAAVHVSNAKAKLGASSRLELALRARDLLAGGGYG